MNTEDQYVDLIVYAISQEVEEREDSVDINNTRIAKIARDVAKNLGLDITHSWYRYGTYVWSEYARIERVEQFRSFGLRDTTVNSTMKRAETVYCELYRDIRKEVANHALVTRESLSEFLPQLYKKAPKPFNRIYESNWKIFSRFSKILRPNSDSYFVPQMLNASREISALQKMIFNLGDYPEVIDLVIEYTNFLESLLVKHDFLCDNYDSLIQFKRHLDDAFDYYKTNIWTLPASIFTINTVRGPREHDVIQRMNQNLSRTPHYVSEVNEKIEKSMRNNFYPTREESEVVMRRMPDLLGEDKKVIDEFFVRSI